MTLESTKKRSTRLIPGIRLLSYQERLNRLSQYFLAYRIIMGDHTET